MSQLPLTFSIYRNSSVSALGEVANPHMSSIVITGVGDIEVTHEFIKVS
jgi:hypothetical protein